MTQAYSTRCPHCGCAHDVTSAVVRGADLPQLKREPIPHDGSISICVQCRRWSIFSYMTPGGLRVPQPEEVEAFTNSPEGRAILRALPHVATLRRNKTP